MVTEPCTKTYIVHPLLEPLIWAFINTRPGINLVQKNTLKFEVKDMHKSLNYELQGEQPLVKYDQESIWFLSCKLLLLYTMKMLVSV